MPPQRRSTIPECHCAACGDTGWRPLTREEKAAIGQNPEYDFSIPCEACVEQRIEKQSAEMQSISALTAQERLLRLDNIYLQHRHDTLSMVSACHEMVEQQAYMLTIWGSNGNAKSSALIATTNEFLDRGIPAVYLPAYDLLNWIQEAIGGDGTVKSESAFQRLDLVKSIRMLAIDEFQAIKVTDWRLEQLRNIIDRRWRDGLDGTSFTLVAMNEDPASLEPRIYSRLRDQRNRANGGSPIIENNDSDMRPLLKRKR